MYSIVIFVFALLSVACAEEIESSTPPPPSFGNLGGTKADRIDFFEKYLETGTEEQKAVYQDKNPVLKEVQKVFNTTLLTQINGCLVHKSMLSSPDQECDRKYAEKADEILRGAFDRTVECLTQFRQRVRTEVDSSIEDIRDVPDKLRTSLILPIDECYDEVKLTTMKRYGQNTADHLICSKKIPI